MTRSPRRRCSASAYPEAYGAHEGAARALAQVTTGEVAGGLTYAHLTGTGPLQADLLRRAAADELGAGGLSAAARARCGRPPPGSSRTPDAYGVRTVTADGQRWTAGAGRWQPDPAAGPGLALS